MVAPRKLDLNSITDPYCIIDIIQDTDPIAIVSVLSCSTPPVSL